MAAGKRKLTSEPAPKRGRGHTGSRKADRAQPEEKPATGRRAARSTPPPAPAAAPEPVVPATPAPVASSPVSEPATEPTAPRRRAHGLDRPEVTELEIGSTVHRVVPDPKPLDVDGIRTMTVGSILWLAAFLGLLPFLGTLQRNGDVWWLWTCLAGFGLGLLGVEYCRRRKVALEAEDETDATAG
ncbi:MULTISPECIES: DUF2530 domain-containing protein [Mumia]|uniref:DUF2530 domain-containing protein n=2 Tax=Mumia TaxID=1546255 RepID=A0ABW1QGZ4_9ACTN|nr:MULTISPECIES: DUF2530 domain-containing protein [Mumia]